jgi:WSC domain
MYQYAGVEYGRECWCGNSLNFNGNPGATPGQNVSDSQCNFECPGNSSEFCGAGVRLNLYWFDLQKSLANL